jgi:hypothetical protein
MTNALLPTFTCFDDAIEFIESRVREEGPRYAADHLRLVHALCEAEDGTIYAHGWAEDKGLCWNAALVEGQKVYYSIKRVDFYRWKKVREPRRYTMEEILDQNRQHGTYGPWEPQFIAACGKTGEGRILGAVQVRGPKRRR